MDDGCPLGAGLWLADVRRPPAARRHAVLQRPEGGTVRQPAARVHLRQLSRFHSAALSLRRRVDVDPDGPLDHGPLRTHRTAGGGRLGTGDARTGQAGHIPPRGPAVLDEPARPRLLLDDGSAGGWDSRLRAPPRRAFGTLTVCPL